MDWEWRSQANCLGIETNLFFPDRGSEMIQQAKAVCHSCVVREQCLQFALVNSERFGIWGGTSERERKRIRRRARAS
jgi:WhiB family redox-sensing transcriptional regulator